MTKPLKFERINKNIGVTGDDDIPSILMLPVAIIGYSALLVMGALFTPFTGKFPE